MKEYIMQESQKEEVRALSSAELLDFQIRLQVECDMTHQDAADFVAQAFKD